MGEMVVACCGEIICETFLVGGRANLPPSIASILEAALIKGKITFMAVGVGRKLAPKVAWFALS